MEPVFQVFREMIRSAILLFVFLLPFLRNAKIAKQVAIALARIARLDVPQEWPTLLPALAAVILA
jgi:hypothetical protein